MSIYSGKCDFADILDIHGEDRIFNDFNVFIYINRKSVPLKFDRKIDMMPFFPHLVSCMASSREGGTIYLAHYPYPYTENLEYWQITVRRFKHKLAYQRKTGELFNLKDFTAQFIREWSLFRDNDEQLWNVCNQILDGKDRIKYPLRNGASWYMTALCNELAMVGIDPTDYGYIIKDGKVVDYDKTALYRHIKKGATNGSRS